MKALIRGLAALLAGLAACQEAPGAIRRAAQAASPIPTPARVAPGLVPLDCDSPGALQPVRRGYCVRLRHYVTRPAREALETAAARVAAQFPGSRILFMEASWPRGERPMPPHLSHGDGREIDLALFWTDLEGRPLARLPNPSGYHAYEPPRREVERVCVGQRSLLNDAPDPPRTRRWKLDEARTTAMVRAFVADPRVRRVFIEPHLKARLGLAHEAKVRFAGCSAARHDDHIHVDFY